MLRGKWIGSFPARPKPTAGDPVTSEARRLAHMLARHWAHLPAWYAFGPPPKDFKPRDGDPIGLAIKAHGSVRAGTEQEKEEWATQMARAENVVAARTVAYVGQYLAHLRKLTNFLAIGAILLLLAGGTYPFQPARFIFLWTWVTVIAVGGLVLLFFIRLDKDEFVSRVSKTAPGQLTLDWTFLSSVLTYIAPLFGILALQVPAVAEFLRTFLEPVLRAASVNSVAE